MAYKKLKYWFDVKLAERLSSDIEQVHSNFNSTRFTNDVKKGVRGLELKDRVELIADCLSVELPDYKRGVKILRKILGPELEKETGMFTEGYWLMPVAKYVEKYGVEHYDLSLGFIQELTKRHTGEYCVRPYIEFDSKKTLAVLKQWSKDSNVHVRRLASEGPRPRLPWAPKLQRFIDNPKPVLPILNNLKDDESKYVQKSVANHVNDILKDNYEIGMLLLEKWSFKPTQQRIWIIKHALRKLKNVEDKRAIKLIKSLG